MNLYRWNRLQAQFGQLDVYAVAPSLEVAREQCDKHIPSHISKECGETEPEVVPGPFVAVDFRFDESRIGIYAAAESARCRRGKPLKGSEVSEALAALAEVTRCGDDIGPEVDTKITDAIAALVAWREARTQAMR